GVVVHGPDIDRSLAHATVEDAGRAVRLGLGSIRNIGTDLAERIVPERIACGPYVSPTGPTARVDLTTAQVEALATAGALSSFGLDRREALWAAAPAAGQRAGRLPGIGTVVTMPALPGMSALELAAADVWATGVSPDSHPMQFLREHLDELGAVPAGNLHAIADG